MPFLSTELPLDDLPALDLVDLRGPLDLAAEARGDLPAPATGLPLEEAGTWRRDFFVLGPAIFVAGTFLVCGAVGSTRVFTAVATAAFWELVWRLEAADLAGLFGLVALAFFSGFRFD